MAYLDSLAQRIKEHIPDEVEVPPSSDGLFILYALLGRAKGAGITREDVHDAWAAWMRLEQREHEALVPFDDLDAATQMEDEPFVIAIKAALAEQ